MSELDGVWDVKRTAGALPPLAGVRKEISGAAGTTKVGRLPGMPFDVVGLSFRYHAPFASFVDVLERDGQGFRGHATFRGREFGKFELKRILTGGEMASEQMKDQLVKRIDEAYAMEQNVLRMLDGMIKTTEDPEIKDELRHHKLETERHAERMQQRLEAHSATPSMVKEAGGIAGALLKSTLRVLGSTEEQQMRAIRDGYATEHLEIASYQLLERIAQQAGDEETAVAARENRKDEEAMAKKLDAHWDKFAELSLKEEGVKVSA